VQDFGYGQVFPHYWWGILGGGGGLFLLCGILGYFLAGTKGNGCWGCGLGCLLGPIGLIIALLIPDQRGR
jgi:hypothetical protein